MCIWTKNEATPSFRQIFWSIWSREPNNPRGGGKKGSFFKQMFLEFLQFSLHRINQIVSFFEKPRIWVLVFDGHFILFALCIFLEWRWNKCWKSGKWSFSFISHHFFRFAGVLCHWWAIHNPIIFSRMGKCQSVTQMWQMSQKTHWAHNLISFNQVKTV